MLKHKYYLDEIALFIEVVKANGFRQAADNLNIPVATLSRKISQLEQELGVRLLKRSTRKIETTEIGWHYYQQSQKLFQDWQSLHDNLIFQKQQIAGVLRLSLTSAFSKLIAPILAAFAQQYPQLNLEIDVSSRLVDLISEPFDLAIRMGRPENSQLIARKLIELPTRLYASPNYLQQQGTPQTVEEIAFHQCLITPQQTIWHLQHQKEHKQQKIAARFKINDMDLLLKLACLDQGIILTSELVAKTALEQGRLQRILPQWQGKAVEVYILSEHRRLPPKATLFIEFLRQHLQC